MDLHSYVRSFTGLPLYRHLTNKGCSSFQALEDVLLPGSTFSTIGFEQFPQFFEKYGPALVSNFTVRSEFKKRSSNRFFGVPVEPKIAMLKDDDGSITDRDSVSSVPEPLAAPEPEPTLEKHAMVAVGYRLDSTGKLILLLQNWWSYRQFVEVDIDYFDSVKASLHVCKTPQHSTRKTYTMVEGNYLEAADELEQQETCMEDY
jgi:hypothetical protein